MPEPIVSRSVVSGLTQQQKPSQVEGPSKDGQSFEQVRQGQAAEKGPDKMDMPPEAAQPTAEVQKAQTAELHKKMRGAKSPQEVFEPDRAKLESDLGKLRKQVDQVKRTPELEPMFSRLEGLERQFQAADVKLKNLGSLDNPRELLQMQMQMYQMTQNFEIVSKVVEQVNSGVKQIVQTQV